MSRVLGRIVGVGATVGGVLVALSVFTTIPVNLFVAGASFAPVLMIAAAVGVIVCLLCRRWVLAVTTTVPIAILAAIVVPLYVSGDPAGDGEPIRVMQANLYAGNADAAAVVEHARSREVDVLTVQELTTPTVDAMDAAGIAAILPHRYVLADRPGGGAGAGIYSRYPLGDTRELEGFAPKNLAATVQSPTPFALVAVHPVPAVASPAEVWTGELDTLRDVLRETRDTHDRVVVSGDFNTTVTHRQFRNLLGEGYDDAADRLGSGLVPTFPADRVYPAFVGIDHVLTAGADARSLERITVPGSDHHGLVVDLVLTHR